MSIPSSNWFFIRSSYFYNALFWKYCLVKTRKWTDILIADACLQSHHGLDIKSICYYMGAASKRYKKCVNTCESTMKRLLETWTILPHDYRILCVESWKNGNKKNYILFRGETKFFFFFNSRTREMWGERLYNNVSTYQYVNNVHESNAWLQ